jgi:hypothetical protein
MGNPEMVRIGQPTIKHSFELSQLDFIIYHEKFFVED